MTTLSFQQGYVALATAFQGFRFDAELLWQTLNDIDGRIFLMAVMDIIKGTKELFPGSNIIAILREKAQQIDQQERASQAIAIESETERERIERWRKEAVPMPEECRIALEKLGITLNHGGKHV